MGQVIAIAPAIDALVLKIRGHVHDAGRAESTCAKHQLQAGLRLLELRATIERDGGDWWAFYEDKFTGFIKSRRYAEKLMQWARSDDPEAAVNAERERVREAVKEVREKERVLRNTQAEQDNSEDLVTKALRIVAKMTADERETFIAQYRREYE